MALDLDKQDFEKVEAAIIAAEKQTSVEFFAVLAERSDDYHYVAGFFASLWLFLFSLLYALLAKLYWVDISLVMFAGSQLACFLAANFIVRTFPGLAIRLVPKSVRFRRAHANAVQQFLAHGISDTSARNGVLIFISVAEHYAEILADHGIAEKTEQSFWDGAVKKLISHTKSGEIAAGYAVTIDMLGEKLTPIFPPSKKKINGLDDKLVVPSSD